METSAELCTRMKREYQTSADEAAIALNALRKEGNLSLPREMEVVARIRSDRAMAAWWGNEARKASQ